MHIPMSAPYTGYTTDETDDDARQQTAEKLGIPAERIEVLRTDGAVLCKEMDDDKGRATGSGAEGDCHK